MLLFVIICLNLKQVPDIKPEPYHGSLNHAMRTNYPISAASQTRLPTTGMFGGSLYPPGSIAPAIYPTRHQLSLPSLYNNHYATGGVDGSLRSESIISQSGPSSILGAPDLITGRVPPQGLPYALVPTTYTSPLGKKTTIERYI